MTRFFTPTIVLFAFLLGCYLTPAVYGAEIYHTLSLSVDQQKWLVGELLKLAEENFGEQIIFYSGLISVFSFVFLSVFGFSVISGCGFIGCALGALVSCGIFADRVFIDSYFGLVVFLGALLLASRFFPLSKLFAPGVAIWYYFSYQANATLIASGFYLSLSFFILLSMLFIVLYREMPKNTPKTTESFCLFLFFMSALFAVFAPGFICYAVVLSGYLVAYTWYIVSKHESATLSKFVLSIHRLKDVFERLPSVGVQWLMLCLIIVNGVSIYRVTDRKVLLPTAALKFIGSRISNREQTCNFTYPTGIQGFVRFTLQSQCPGNDFPKANEIQESEVAMFSRLDPEYFSLSKNPEWQIVFQGSGHVEWTVFSRGKRSQTAAKP